MDAKAKVEETLLLQWSSFSELYTAVRKAVGGEVTFDCFEEWKPGEVIIRRNPIGQSDQSFDVVVKLATVAIAAE